ncbi:MAG: hypothetical protein K9K81_03775 [Desulfobacteraceae bacterium]|jgi:hypothetical protein|nr:hypothetical protein [Desulfobacteraceae bacterium]
MTTVFSGDISRMVLKRSLRADQGEVSLDSQMLQVLMELDGKKRLSEVSQSLQMSMKELRTVVQKLHQLKLCEVAEESMPVLDRDFMKFLSSQLSRAMGPIADVVIEDEIREMGETANRFPAHRAAELVDLLARQILREERKVAFQQAMVKKLREIQA